jgi:hypothetical protein
MASNSQKRIMIFVLEAMAALAALLFMVWWTMFSGRKKGEPPREDGQGEERDS